MFLLGLARESLEKRKNWHLSNLRTLTILNDVIHYFQAQKTFLAIIAKFRSRSNVTIAKGPE